MNPSGLLLLVTLIWGSTFVVTKDVVAVAPPFLYLTLRYGIAAVGLFFVVARRIPWRDRRFFRDGAVVALLSASGLILQVLGQVYTTAAKSSFITSLATPLTPLFAYALYRVAPRGTHLIGVALAFLGLLLLTYPSENSALNAGDIMTLFAALIFGFTIVEISRRAPRYSGIAFGWLQVALSTCIYATCALAPLPFPALAALEARPFPLTSRAALEVGYMAIVCTAINVPAQTWAMSRMSATRAAIIFALEPVFATAFALVVYGASEWPGSRGAVGAGLIVAAVLVSEARVRSRS